MTAVTAKKSAFRDSCAFMEVAMKFTRVLLGVFALLLFGAAMNLISQEKSSPTHASYTYAPSSEQTMIRIVALCETMRTLPVIPL